MHNISENLKYIRKSQGWTQSDFARQLGVKRSLIGAYEEGRADPRISFLQLICETFSLSLDQLINESLSGVNINKNQDIAGKSLRVLPIAIELKSNEEHATLVPVKAAAGYLNGFGDIEFIEKLPAFSLPFPELSKGKTYRLFQISGDSMLPIQSGSYVIASFLVDWSEIKNDKCYVLVTKSEGIVFKRVLNELKYGKLRLKSDNRAFDTFEIDINDVMEVWTAEGITKIGLDMEPLNISHTLSDQITDLQSRLDRIETKLKNTK